ncbi:hypothetical protein Fmac_023510 [Flemingia macrophylla]|uniref:Magnesium transporter n=1 Tax=Flemingia macrophylla TaxID=520843 RepID=A0ABD1LLR4_9FABA
MPLCIPFGFTLMISQSLILSSLTPTPFLAPRMFLTSMFLLRKLSLHFPQHFFFPAIFFINIFLNSGFQHIKAIITAGEVLLRDPADENVNPVVEELQRRLPRLNASNQQGNGKEYLGGQNDAEAAEEDESPFEFRALEVALDAIGSFLAARTTELEMAAYQALDELTSKIRSRNLDRVRKLKNAMTRLTARVQMVREVLEQLLDNDDDMADLYLSRKGSSSPVSGCKLVCCLSHHRIKDI